MVVVFFHVQRLLNLELEGNRAYQSRPNGSASEIRSTPRLSLRGRTIEYEALNRAKLPNHQDETRAAPNEHDHLYPSDCRSRS